MKKYILIILTCIISYHLEAQQHPNLEEIKKYYLSIDKEKLIDTLLERNYIEHKQLAILFDSSLEKLVPKRNEYIEKICNDSSIITLTLILRNVENYSFDKNIYDFLFLDTTRIHIKYFDKQKEEIIGLFSDGYLEVEENDFGKIKSDNFQDLINVLEKEKPEILFEESPFFIDLTGQKIFYNINFLFLKNDKIYVYRLRNKKTYELNEFVRKFYNEKEFKEWATFKEKEWNKKMN